MNRRSFLSLFAAIRGWIRWKVAWLKWFAVAPGYRFGDPLLGDGAVREKNRRIIVARWNAREPKRDDYR